MDDHAVASELNEHEERPCWVQNPQNPYPIVNTSQHICSLRSSYYIMLCTVENREKPKMIASVQILEGGMTIMEIQGGFGLHI